MLVGCEITYQVFINRILLLGSSSVIFFFLHYISLEFQPFIWIDCPRKFILLKFSEGKKKMFSYKLHFVWYSLWDCCWNQIDLIIKHAFLPMFLLYVIKKEQ